MKTLSLSRVLIALSIVACTKGSQPSIAQQTQTNTSTSVSEGRRTAITAAVASVAPSVVTVQTTMVEQINPDAFAAMFGARPTTRVTPGLGTGFVVRNDGVIVTNAHVIAGADTISVMMRDGKIYAAKKLGARRSSAWTKRTTSPSSRSMRGTCRSSRSATPRRSSSASGRSPSAIRTASSSATASQA
jgi:S1-C subfamily serine protease